ncbi:MAG: HAMP domain-containing protein [Leptolyngbyaceae bacterium]|nr:HAMP domain-containing protein [Leptolyngbyaceae bacterium]
MIHSRPTPSAPQASTISVNEELPSNQPMASKFRLKDFLSLFTSRLSLRIVLLMFVGLSLIEAILFVPSIQRQRREVLSQIEDVSSGKISWILMTYPQASGDELLNHVATLGDDPMLQMILGGAVYQSNGVRIGEFGEPPELTFARASEDKYFYAQSSAGDRYDAAWVAQQPDDNYYIVIRHDASGMRQELRSFVIRIVSLVLITSASLTLVMMLLLGPTVISPILKLKRDLSEAGESISSGNAVEPQLQTTSIQRRDELGDVARTFQTMYRQIFEAMRQRKQAERELRQNNDQMRQYIIQVDRITTAAAAVEDGTFEPSSLEAVAQRSDELGQLARVFQHMATEVKERESQLRQEVTDLRVEIDQAKRERQVAQITETDYFKDLKAKAKDLRRPGNCG